jgi:hypothetical protein
MKRHLQSCVARLVVMGVLGTLAGACAPAVSESDHAPSPAGDEPRFVAGSHWIESLVARQEAWEELPGSLAARAVFLDLNRNGVLDPYGEPSTPCTRDGEQWDCSLDPRQILIQRVSSARSNDVFVIPRWDARAVTASDYDDAESGVEFCLGDGAGCSRAWSPEPTSEKEWTAFSACSDADLVLWTRDGTGQRSVRIPRRPSMRVAVDRQTLSDGGARVWIRGADAPRVDRKLVWLGDETDPHWSTERVEATWAWWEDAISVDVPADALSACHGCDLGVALADHERWQDPETSATVLDVRQVQTIFASEGL